MKSINDRVISYRTRKGRRMRVTEKLVNSPEEEGVTLEYIRLTKDFEEIKEYVRHKGETLSGYKQTKEKVSVRIEDLFAVLQTMSAFAKRIGAELTVC